MALCSPGTQVPSRFSHDSSSSGLRNWSPASPSPSAPAARTSAGTSGSLTGAGSGSGTLSSWPRTWPQNAACDV